MTEKTGKIEDTHNLKAAIIKHTVVESTVSTGPAAAIAAIRAVLDKHQPIAGNTSCDTVCSSCVEAEPIGEVPVLWPCETFETIATAIEIPAR